MQDTHARYAAWRAAEAERMDNLRHARGANPEQPMCHAVRLADDESEVTCRACLKMMRRAADLDRSSSGE